jgi:hypothetical protein
MRGRPLGPKQRAAANENRTPSHLLLSPVDIAVPSSLITNNERSAAIELRFSPKAQALVQFGGNNDHA